MKWSFKTLPIIELSMKIEYINSTINLINEKIKLNYYFILLCPLKLDTSTLKKDKVIHNI